MPVSEVMVTNSSRWIKTDDGNYRRKLLVGRSSDGWHGGIKVSVRGGTPTVQWSEASPSKSEAKAVSLYMDEYYRMGTEPDLRHSLKISR